MGFLMNHCVPRQGDVCSWNSGDEEQDWDFQEGLGRRAPGKPILAGFGMGGTHSEAPWEGGTLQVPHGNLSVPEAAHVVGCVRSASDFWQDDSSFEGRAGGRGWRIQLSCLIPSLQNPGEGDFLLFRVNPASGKNNIVLRL